MEAFTADRKLRVDIVVKRGLRNPPNPEYRDKRIVVDVTHADPQAPRYTCGQAALIMVDQLSLLPRRGSANTTLDRDMCSSTSGATK